MLNWVSIRTEQGRFPANGVYHLLTADLLMLTIFHAETPEHIALARELMTEYATALEFNLCFQNFEREMAELPGKYAAPSGRLLLAFHDNRPAGVIAMRPLTGKGADENIQRCEMKRLFVRPAFRGLGLGRILAERLIAEARACGYSSMRLDTVRGPMDRAIEMYREMGFREIPAYCENPMPGVLYLELALAGRPVADSSFSSATANKTEE
jgi:putative acetyltransferase